MNSSTFMAKVSELYPDSSNSGVISRTQIMEVMKAIGETKWPKMFDKNTRSSRGMYYLFQKTPECVENVVPLVKTQPENVISNKQTDVNVKSFIPPVDSNYVPFGIYKDIETIIKTNQFYPVYISGPTGNGKSTAVEQACAKLKRPLIRINLNMMTDEDQLIGSKTLIDGNVEVVEGPIIIAMRYGIPLLLDEIDAGGANNLLCLQPILEGKPYYFKLKNELIYPAPGFNIFATANTKGKGSDDGRYIGTFILNEAFLERFSVTLEQKYPTPTIEYKIILNVMNQFGSVDKEFAKTLIKWADAIRKTFDDGGIDETITTRRLIHIVKAHSIFKNKNYAIELCTNRFDEITRQAFNSLFEKVSSEEEDTGLSVSEPSENQI